MSDDVDNSWKELRMETKPAPGRPEEGRFEVTIDQQDRYRFGVDFQIPGVDILVVDEPQPLGGGEGPGPTRMLAASVGCCLAMSLLFCLDRSRIPVMGMHVRVAGVTARNDAGRLRIPRLEVTLEPHVAEADIPRLKRCLDVFEDYCTVSGSVRTGIEMAVDVKPRATPEE
jgi:uncharacterized OsmC-like protein